MSEAVPAPDESHGLIGRSYTRARRHPWVIGKIQGWTLPLGPFTATQLATLVIGLWLLVQTAPLWSGLGPLAAIVIALPFAATWAVRHAQIEGRAPARALGGYLALLTAPAAGTMRGRPLIDPAPERLTGLITIAEVPANPSGLTGGHPQPAAPAHPPAAAPAPGTGRPRPTGLQALLADLEQE